MKKKTLKKPLTFLEKVVESIEQNYLKVTKQERNIVRSGFIGKQSRNARKFFGSMFYFGFLQNCKNAFYIYLIYVT